MALDSDALEYHSSGRPGKIEVVPTKPCDTERSLSLAYTPGVAAACKEIAKNVSKVYEYTARGNLVAVITNGTAVLGLGNIGPEAGKPVMEGKGVLFKKFADIDVFDIEMRTTNVEEFITAVKCLEPTFGGINLEDVSSPDCFVLESELKKIMKIPVFHDDQHGTAIITGAAMVNAAELAGKPLSEIKIVMNGPGAAGLACAKMFVQLGVKKSNIMMCDTKGVLYKGRQNDMNPYKAEFAVETERRTLTEALDGADAFVGLSVANCVTQDMIKKMGSHPIVFAMANPIPEISPEDVRACRPDAIIATGRSDYPNQVNNVLGFPFIFRGALDVRATQINEEMKLAAVEALSKLAREEVPDTVSLAYGGKKFKFGPDYLIPKPFDPRVLLWVAPAVARAAMKTGVAQIKIEDFQAYHDQLEGRQGGARSFVRAAINRVKMTAKKEALPKIIFPEGHSDKVLKALSIIVEEQMAEPVILGYEDIVGKKIVEMGLDHLRNIPIFQPSRHPNYLKYVRALFELRKRKGVNLYEAERLMTDPNYFAAMAVHLGDCDAMITGATQNYADSVRPILKIIGRSKGGVPSGLVFMVQKDKVILFADVTVNINPSAEELATIAVHAAEVAEAFAMEPRIAMLSFTNFAANHEGPAKMRRAAEIVKERYPHLLCDGEMQADTAINADIMARTYPFSEIKKSANILVFPNLDSGNISYKLVQQMSGGTMLGPFLMGVRRAANVLQRSSTVDDIVNVAALTALQVQAIKEKLKNR
ncbi:MAG: NADP-dependent malic enzyme [Bdellovibrionia bacterium]